jgi:S-(hydroxymethyl)glutathione dehydrogenase/alcohol dehydrogenase
MTEIRAAVCYSFGDALRIETLILADPGPGQVRVRLEACAICHSDVHFAEGAWPSPLPAVYGHEAAGHVETVGPGVTGYAPGDKVLVTLLRACGRCLCCSTGRPALCSNKKGAPSPLTTPDGDPVGQGMETAAFAEACVVHHSQLAPLPDTIASDVACLLACGVITGAGAVLNTARVRAGSSVVVIGAGGVGLNAIQAAAIAGATRVIAIDLSEEKLADAQLFGATDGVLATADTPHKRVRALTGGRGADYVFVTVGAIAAYASAPRFLAPGGTMVMVGMPESGATVDYEPVILTALGQSLVGSNMGDAVLTRDIPFLIDLYGQGRLKLDELITGHFPLDRINDAIAATKSGLARRNVIRFD